jgi:hypothetical protein
MREGRVERRLAAILAADVAGYSRLMAGRRSRGTMAGVRDQATCSSATRTVPLVSGLSSSEMTTLAAATTVPTSIGMA